MPHRRPRPNRSSVTIDARLTRACGNSEQVIVENLSIDGCAIRGWFKPEEQVILTLPRIGTFDASVRWARGGRAGLRFARARP